MAHFHDCWVNEQRHGRKDHLVFNNHVLCGGSRRDGTLGTDVYEIGHGPTLLHATEYDQNVLQDEAIEERPENICKHCWEKLRSIEDWEEFVEQRFEKYRQYYSG